MAHSEEYWEKFTDSKEMAETELVEAGGEETPVLSSRLCVKGLPKHINSERLKEIFSLRGQVSLRLYR